MIEMREAAQERALDLIDESKDLHRQQKLVMCELEDALYDCFESSEEKEEPKDTEEGTDLGFKDKYNRHYAMRNFDKDYDDDEDMRHHYRRAMRMRRNRMGRFV